MIENFKNRRAENARRFFASLICYTECFSSSECFLSFRTLCHFKRLCHPVCFCHPERIEGPFGKPQDDKGLTKSDKGARESDRWSDREATKPV